MTAEAKWQNKLVCCNKPTDLSDCLNMHNGSDGYYDGTDGDGDNDDHDDGCW